MKPSQTVSLINMELKFLCWVGMQYDVPDTWATMLR